MEEFFLLKNIILQGLRSGYMNKSVGKTEDVDMYSGRWRTTKGVDLGSTWDIILSKDFANCLWKEKADEILQKLVIMNSPERIDLIKGFVIEESIQEVEVESVEETPADGLTMAIRESLVRLKEYSLGLYKDSCNDTYEKLSGVVSKNSVTELKERDFVVLNAMNRVMTGNLINYLSQNGKKSFAMCPECGGVEFAHEPTCSINVKTDDWLLDRNEGC